MDDTPQTALPAPIEVRAPCIVTRPFPDYVFFEAERFLRSDPDRSRELADALRNARISMGHPEHTEGILGGNPKAMFDAAQDLSVLAHHLPSVLREAVKDLTRGINARAEGKGNLGQFFFCWVGCIGLELALRAPGRVKIDTAREERIAADQYPFVRPFLDALHDWGRAVKAHTRPVEGGRMPLDRDGARALTEVLGGVEKVGSTVFLDLRTGTTSISNPTFLAFSRAFFAMGIMVPSEETGHGLFPVCWAVRTRMGTLAPRSAVEPGEIIPAAVLEELAVVTALLEESIGDALAARTRATEPGGSEKDDGWHGAIQGSVVVNDHDEKIEILRIAAGAVVNRVEIKAPTLVKLFRLVSSEQPNYLTWTDVEKRWPLVAGWKGKLLGVETLKDYGRRIRRILVDAGLGPYWRYSADEVAWIPPSS